MARRYRKLKVQDPKLHKKLKREAALMEAAARRARAARGKPPGLSSAVAKNNYPAGVIGEAKEKAVMTDTNEEIRNDVVNNESTADVKEVVKEVIVNNSSEGSKVNALIERNNRKMSSRQRKENDAEIIASMQSDDMKILAALLMDME